MRKFIIKLAFITSLFLIVFYSLCTLADGYTDAFYIRFTTEKKQNLILGTSRSAQGIIPQELNKKINKSFFNFSFTVQHSPYGQVYFNAIKNKLNQDSKNQIFILSVNPWSISSRTQDPNDFKNFREKGLILDNMKLFNVNPNFEYLLKNIDGNYFDNLIKQPDKKNMFLHKDGWLEIRIPMDSSSVSKRITNKINFYKEKFLPKYKFSNRRFNKLKEIILYLNQFGEVYLVRLPVHEEMYNLETELMPNFNEKIEELDALFVKYIDFTTINNLYKYTDGNHLYKTSGAKVTKEIAEIIKKTKFQNNDK